MPGISPKSSIPMIGQIYKSNGNYTVMHYLKWQKAEITLVLCFCTYPNIYICLHH